VIAIGTSSGRRWGVDAATVCQVARFGSHNDGGVLSMVGIGMVANLSEIHVSLLMTSHASIILSEWEIVSDMFAMGRGREGVANYGGHGAEVLGVQERARHCAGRALSLRRRMFVWSWHAEAMVVETLHLGVIRVKGGECRGRTAPR